MIARDNLAIELRGVTLQHRRQTVLDAVDLSVEAGQSCGVVGPNGSGKSVLLRIVAGLCRPSRGEVRVGGVNAVEQPGRVRRMIGYAADELGLAERMSPREHLEMVAAQRGLDRADRQAATESMLELVDLAGARDRPVAALSRGQRRRLSLALALVHDPAVVLLDEPMSGVDEVGRGELTSVILELRSMGKTLLIASQAPSEIAEVCDAIAPLESGRLQQLGQTDTPALTWLEIVGDPVTALRTLREHPGVDDVRQDGAFITFRGPSQADERSGVAEWLIANGVHLAGFGATSTPAGGVA